MIVLFSYVENEKLYLHDSISYQLNRLWHFGLPEKLHIKQNHPTISMSKTQK
jgi:hypothetical protein